MRTAKETKAVMDSPGLDKNQILQMQRNLVEWYGIRIMR